MTSTNSASRVGTLDRNGDVGDVQLPGAAVIEGDGLAVTGSGHNMWLDQDQFHFAWSEVEGDWSLSATARFRGEGTNAHRKAVVLVRADLGTAAVYAGLALHGDGLTSLQYRTHEGAMTQEIRFAANAPTRLSLRRAGELVETVAGDEGHSVQLALPRRYYIGLGVCSHVDDIAETVDFSDIELTRLA